MNFNDISIGLAFLVGVISFLSPCVLPLVPAYIGYLGGRLTNRVASEVTVNTGGQAAIQTKSRSRFDIVLHGVFFVLGFTFVFVLTGLLTTAFVQQVGGRNVNLVKDMIGRFGGLLIIFFGLHTMGAIPWIFRRLQAEQRLLASPVLSLALGILGISILLWGFTATLTPAIYSISTTTAGQIQVVNWPTIISYALVVSYGLWLFLGGAFTQPAVFWGGVIARVQTLLYADTRRQMTSRGDSYAASALMGVIFSAGWAPCIGPLYGAVLTYSANTGDVVRAAPLLVAYSLGLGVPFLATAFLLDGAQGFLKRMQRHMRAIEIISGAFLVVIGVLVASGQLQSLSQYLQGQYSEFSVNLENQVVGSINGNAASSTPVATVVPTPAASALNSIAGAAAAYKGPESGTDIGNVAPNFESVTDAGKPVKLSELKGQVVVLNFWATWCAPCKVEMPEFEKAYQTNGNNNFTVLAINNSESLDQVKTFRQQMNVTFPMVMDEKGELQRQYGVVSYPSTYVLNKDGVIIAKQFGPMTGEQIDTLVNKALAS